MTKAKILLVIEGLFDVRAALDELQIGYATLYRYISKGLITSIRINGRNYFTKSDIERLKSQRQNDRPEAKPPV